MPQAVISQVERAPRRGELSWAPTGGDPPAKSLADATRFIWSSLVREFTLRASVNVLGGDHVLGGLCAL